jgi:hypothetical protein
MTLVPLSSRKFNGFRRAHFRIGRGTRRHDRHPPDLAPFLAALPAAFLTDPVLAIDYRADAGHAARSDAVEAVERRRL